MKLKNVDAKKRVIRWKKVRFHYKYNAQTFFLFSNRSFFHMEFEQMFVHCTRSGIAPWVRIKIGRLFAVYMNETKKKKIEKKQILFHFEKNVYVTFFYGWNFSRCFISIRFFSVFHFYEISILSFICEYVYCVISVNTNKINVETEKSVLVNKFLWSVFFFQV